jgi:RimJ/RimL family protein N-acetyltransferase
MTTHHGSRYTPRAIVPASGVRMRLAKDGKQVTLRRAQLGDVLVLFDWQREPTTRRLSRNPLAPELEEHRRWFERRLKSNDCMLFIVEHDQKPAGLLRFDRLAVEKPSTWEVSIFMAHDKRRLGITSAALDLGRSLLPGAELVVEVLSQNRVARALFRTAGYASKPDGRLHSKPKPLRYDKPRQASGCRRKVRSSRALQRVL